MKPEQIIQAIDVLQWLGQRAGELPEDAEKGVAMHLQMVMVSLYLVEYVTHIQEGMEPYEALLATARGEMKIADSPQLTMFNLLRPRPDVKGGEK